MDVRLNSMNRVHIKKVIVFCLSYLSVPLTISLVEASDNNFLIVTSNKHLLLFFRRIYPDKNIFYLESLPLFSKNPFRFIFNLYSVYKYKKDIYDKFKIYRKIKVYFSAVAYCDFECWLIKIMSTTNDVFYKPSVSLQYLNPGQSVQIKFGKWIRKLVYSVDFDGMLSNRHIRYAVSREFLREINAKEFQITINFESICQKIIDSLPEIACARVLVLCGGIAESDVDKCEYIQKMDSVIEFLEKKYGYNALVIKSHPRFNNYFSKEKTLISIPADIPANLVISHFDLVIGYSTATLIEAANEGITSISLLRMMKPINRYDRDKNIEYLEENTKNSILYPEKLEALIAITPPLKK